MKKSAAFILIVIVLIITIVIMNFFKMPFVSGQSGKVSLSLGLFDVTILEPRNITYNFNFTDYPSVYINVTSSRNVTSWSYSLVHNGILENYSIPFNPNDSIRVNNGRYRLIVYAIDNYYNNVNYSVSFFVNLTNPSPIISNISNILVCENKWLPDYGFPLPYFNITNIDGDIISVGLTPFTNPFYVSNYYNYNSTLYTYEIFSGVLDKASIFGGVNVGNKTFTENAYASDGVNQDNKKFNITVIEVNNAPTMSNIGVRTLFTKGDNSTLNYTVLVNDTEDGNQNGGLMTFNATFSNLTMFYLNKYGKINFAANDSFLGVNNITVCVKDRGLLKISPNISLCGQNGGPISRCTNFSITVTNQNRQPYFLSSSPKNLSISTTGYGILQFNVTTYDADHTIPDVYWYVDDILKEYTSNSYPSFFTYMFGCGISGTHNVKVEITDGLLNNSIEWTIDVTNVECPTGFPTGGGGGSSAGKGEICNEKWGCSDFNNCRNLQEAKDYGETIYGLGSLIKDRCSLFNWGTDICGFQVRSCHDVNKCGTNKTMPGLIRECYYSENPTCSDGIFNCHDGSCEILTDCGGPCAPCPSCSDNIKNQGEEDTDCGGPCPPCQKVINEIPRQTINLAAVFFGIVFLVAFIAIIILVVIYYRNKRMVALLSKKPENRFFANKYRK